MDISYSLAEEGEVVFVCALCRCGCGYVCVYALRVYVPIICV